MNKFGVALVLVLAGCGGSEDACKCTGVVPGGYLDVECGKTACLIGNGYKCVGPNDAVPDVEACPKEPEPSCTPSCQGKRCGDDGCGGSCGKCTGGYHCSSGLCAQDCTPNCQGKMCGPDGCGGSCGSCGADQYCNDHEPSPGSGVQSKKGQCLAKNWCASTSWYTDTCWQGCCPDLPFREFDTNSSTGYRDCRCRPTCIPADSYNSECGTDADCCSDSKCVNSTGSSYSYCTGGCRNSACTASREADGSGGCCESHPYCWGSQGCSSSKGYAGSKCADDAACSTGLTCVAGLCKAPCTPNCTGRSCGDDGCGGSCGMCATGTCKNGSCCVPNCTNKQCGDDGCGGSCGSCGGGTCLAGSCCTPNCSGKQCGDNGCGGSCGSCGLGKLCSTGTCVADPDWCDPVTNTGCMAPNECILLSNEKTTCALAGSGTQGSSCSASVTCDGGYGCFAGSCRKICDKDTSQGCSVSQVCNGVAGWINYGACQ